MPARVLVVDDDEELRTLLADMLGALDHVVETAETGQEALDLLAVQSYDLILTDFRMAGMDGEALFRRIQDQWPHLAPRVVFVTGQDTVDIGGGTASVPILPKPYSFDSLQAMITRVLNQVT